MIRACDVLPRAARVNESKKGRYHSIIRSHLRNLTQRAISKAHGVNRRTVAATIKRVQAGLSLTPTLNTGKRYADRLLSPPWWPCLRPSMKRSQTCSSTPFWPSINTLLPPCRSSACRLQKRAFIDHQIQIRGARPPNSNSWGPKSQIQRIAF